MAAATFSAQATVAARVATTAKSSTSMKVRWGAGGIVAGLRYAREPSGALGAVLSAALH